MASPVICIGATLIDELFFCTGKAIAGTSNPATSKRSAGGVVCNIARHLGMLGIAVELITVVGNDAEGKWLKDEIKKCNVGTNNIIETDEATGKYVSILNDDGSLFGAACSDVSVQFLTPALLEKYVDLFLTASLIVSDTNLSVDAISWLSKFCFEKKIKLIIEPVSVLKSKKIAAADVTGIFMVTPNEDEIINLINKESKNEMQLSTDILNRGIQYIWLRKGNKGSAIICANKNIHLDAAEISVTDSTGAGDAALAGWIAAHLWGWSELQCLQTGHTMAYEVLQITGALLENYHQQKLLSDIQKYFPDVT